jgi:NADH:ubiquinone oxidoreductase subunit E
MDNSNCEKNKLGTEEQKIKFCNYIKQAKKQNWSTIKMLEEIQNIYGYLPKNILEYYSLVCKKTMNEIYGVATFYSQFSLVPKGKYVISICLGTACYVNGSELILEKFCRELKIKPGECTPDGKFSIDETRCLGCCGISPVVTVNNDVYRTVKVSDVENILSNYKDK